MTTAPTVAESPHNHPPHCCCAKECNCGSTRGMHAEWCMLRPCPACPEHGIKPEPIGCPQCHEPIGRPHTDYCSLAPGEVWDGVLPEVRPTDDPPDPITCDGRNCGGRPHS